MTLIDLSVLASQPLAAAISNIFLALFTVLLTTVIRAAVVYINARTTDSQRTTIAGIASLSVSAAEQLALANHINPSQKKQYAEDVFSHELSRIGLSITATQIDTAIEAAVFYGLNFGRTLTPPAAVAPSVAPATQP